MKTKKKGKLYILPGTGFAKTNNEIAKLLGQLAATIAEEEPVRSVICLIEMQDGELRKETYGHEIDHARAMGLLAIALGREL